MLNVWMGYVAISVVKVVFAGWKQERCSHPWVCGSGCFGEKRECLQKMLPRDEVAGCRSRILHRSRHSQFWGWRKVVPVCGVLNSSNSYSTGNPWSKRIDARGPQIRWFSSWWWWCCCYWRERTVITSVLNEEVLRKRECLVAFPNLCCPERWFGLKRISNPDWVKICIDPNSRIKLRAKQKYEILSATVPTNNYVGWMQAESWSISAGTF